MKHNLILHLTSLVSQQSRAHPVVVTTVSVHHYSSIPLLIIPFSFLLIIFGFLRKIQIQDSAFRGA